MKINNVSQQVLLLIIGIGIWFIVLQNAGIIPTSQNVRVVNTVDSYVKGGNIEAEVTGNVDVDNEVEVDIRRINGWNAANYNEYSIDGEEFHSLGTK